LENYEEWDVTISPLPSRSRLYRLEPIGIGTPYVECLTSYVARLARMHHVLPKELVKREILPAQGIMDTNVRFYGRLNDIWTGNSRSINSIGPITDRWLKALQMLTFCDDLHFLTMFTWSEIISVKNLIRFNKAWCPRCFEDRKKAHQILYEPLLWSLNEVNVCPIHRQPLITKCSVCQKSQPFLVQSTLVGCCSYCGSWLGSGSELVEEAGLPVADDIEKQIWVAEVIGELLATAPNFSRKPLREPLVANMQRCLEQYTGGNLNSFARLCGINDTYIRGFLYKGQMLRLEIFLRICSALSIPPLDFFRLTEAQFLQPQKFRLDLLPKSLQYRRKRERLKNEDIQDIRLYLETILRENPASPPNLTEVALVLGCSVTVLRDHCPDLSKLFATRRRPLPEKFFEKARLELENALTCTRSVPLSEVLRRLNCDRDVLNRYFPDLCQAVVTRYRERFNYEELRMCLQEALTSNEVVSVKEVVQQLGCSTSLAYERFPDLYKQVVMRWRTAQRKRHEQRIENDCNSIKQAILVLKEQGIFPSERRISSILCDRYIMRKKEYKLMRLRIIDELGL